MAMMPADAPTRMPRRPGNPSARRWPQTGALLLCLVALTSCSDRPRDGQTAAPPPAPAPPSEAEAHQLLQPGEPPLPRRRQPRQYARRATTQAAADLATLAADLIQAKDQATRRKLLDKLGSYCDPAALPIVEGALADASPEVRAAALEALSGYTTPDVVPLVLKGLQDADAGVRRAAMEALSCVEDRRAAEPVALAFTDADSEVREAAFETLQELPYDAKLPLLEEALRAPTADVRRNAVSELEDLGNHDAMDLVIGALKDSDAQVREDAADAIWFLVSERFTDHEAARRWWEKNRGRFDEDLFEKD